MVNVIIGGDVCPIGKNLSYFKLGDANSIFNDLLFEIEDADLSIVNLECPLIEDDTPIVKTGPVLGVDSDCISGLKQAKIDVVNLSNNHIMDHGSKGLINTLKTCARAEILTVGAGKNIAEARRIVIKKVGKMGVGILAVAEHEFSIAGETSWGANPLDLADYVRNIKDNTDNVDFLIVLFHGGNENYPYPSPRLKDISRFMVEMGANAVIVQHTHCPGCYEKYKGSFIVYRQGNLIFDIENMDKTFYEGFLVKLSIADDLTSIMDIIPYLQSVNKVGARRLNKEADRCFQKSLSERCVAIRDDSFVLAEWLKFCEGKKEQYLNRIFGHNRIIRKLINSKRFVKLFYSKESINKLQNTIFCEAHREVLEVILSEYLQD